MPTPTAVHRPVAASIEATDVVPLDHAPPTVELLSVAVCDWHNANVPVIAPGVGSTVNVMVVKQPDGNVYVIVAVPGAGVADTPVTTPVPIPTLAVAGALLVHVPPAVGCVRVVVSPSHTDVAPTIGAGAAVTVATTVLVQPALNEYVTIVVPADTPYRTPVVEPMVPTARLLLLQVPPDAVVVNVPVLPTHTGGPNGGVAVATTVITLVTEQPAT